MHSPDTATRQDGIGWRWERLGIGLGLFVFLALLLAPPHDPLDKADRFAYAVCHRLPSHSFTIGGRQLPLCARCSGTYLGALAGLAVLLIQGRGRANRFPARRFLAVFAVFIAGWAADGLNSYLGLLGLPSLYAPNNVLRLVTGTLEGLVIAVFVLPLFNLGIWADQDHAMPPVARWRDLLWLLLGGAMVVGLVASGWEPLLYPLALLSGAMVVLLVGLVISLLLLIVIRRDGRAQHWREAFLPLTAGFAGALLALAAIGLARDLLTAWLGLPF